MDKWFRVFMDAAPEVDFRYALAPARRFVYLSRAIEALTGHPPAAFYSDAAFCVPLVIREDRHVLRQIVRARRGLNSAIGLTRRDGTVVRVALRTVPVVRGRQVVAIEGVASVEADGRVGGANIAPQPVQQRLAALLYEVHDLLHGTLPPRTEGGARPRAQTSGTMLRAAGIAMDVERMAATLDGEPVALTSRELMVLRYLLQHADRIVTRQQLLTEVWGYRYTGDARTVDVHISRLRRKLPPLREMLRAVKHVGYCLDMKESASADDRRIANI
jgi:DNA-binding winged helix-turn-helix (wHTH) protein